jgi:hypothetical protein
MFTPMLCDYHKVSRRAGMAYRQSGHGVQSAGVILTIVFVLYERLAHARRALGMRVANGRKLRREALEQA